MKTIEDPAARVTALKNKFPRPQTLIMAGRRRATAKPGGRCCRRRSSGVTPRDPTAADASGRPRTALWSATSMAALRRKCRRRAAERLIMTADQAAQMLVKMMEDTEVPFGVRAKIAQDLLDRAGLIATQVHQIIPTTEDPVMRFFEEAFSDPSNWEENPPQPAIEDRVLDQPRSDGEPEEIVEAEIVEPEGEPANDTPPRIAEMIKAGAFDRKAGQ